MRGDREHAEVWIGSWDSRTAPFPAGQVHPRQRTRWPVAATSESCRLRTSLRFCPTEIPAFRQGNATNIESSALSARDPCDFMVNLIGKRSSAHPGRFDRQPLGRHARPCAGHPRLSCNSATSKTWMAGTSPAMTRTWINFSGMRASAPSGMSKER
jgi:hypothetical protein